MSKLQLKAKQVLKQHAGKLSATPRISEDTLCEWFGISKPQISGMDFDEARKHISKFGFAKLSAYNALNTNLRTTGRVIVQTKNDYVVRAGESDTKGVITRYTNRIETLKQNRATLIAAFRG